MKEGIHPKTQVVTVKCACGNTFETLSTKSDLRVDICSNCHPFYTGKQKLVDTGGRVDKFKKRMENLFCVSGLYFVLRHCGRLTSG